VIKPTLENKLRPTFQPRWKILAQKPYLFLLTIFLKAKIKLLTYILNRRGFQLEDAQFNIESLLGEVKTRVLSLPCPQCGAPQNKPVSPGEKVRCDFCKTIYTVEASLDAANKETIKKIVSSAIEDFVGKYGLTLDKEFSGFSNRLEEYAKKVLDETRSFYQVQNRLPTREELDQKLDIETQKILRSIVSVAQDLLQGQTTLSVQIDSVTGKIDSLKVSVKEIKRLIERLQSFYGKESHVIGSKDEAFIIYRDDLNNLNKVKFKEVIIGRNEQTHKVELRFPDGNVKSLGIADPTVSRKHLRLNVIDSKIIITDLGSKNGTYINSARITSNTPYELKSEAKIKIGFNTEFELKIADSM